MKDTMVVTVTEKMKDTGAKKYEVAKVTEEILIKIVTGKNIKEKKVTNIDKTSTKSKTKIMTIITNLITIEVTS